jgi:hypothetical protein
VDWEESTAFCDLIAFRYCQVIEQIMIFSLIFPKPTRAIDRFNSTFKLLGINQIRRIGFIPLQEGH